MILKTIRFMTFCLGFVALSQTAFAQEIAPEALDVSQLVTCSGKDRIGGEFIRAELLIPLSHVYDGDEEYSDLAKVEVLRADTGQRVSWFHVRNETMRINAVDREAFAVGPALYDIPLVMIVTDSDGLQSEASDVFVLSKSSLTSNYRKFQGCR